MRRRPWLVGLLVSLTWIRPATAGERRADVVVFGATGAGAIAAIAAAREGCSVILVEPGRHVGGMVSGGLGATDTGNRRAIGGYAREFFDRVREHYKATYGAGSEQARLCSDGFHFEPHVAEATFQAMLREARVEVVWGQAIQDVVKDGPRIVAITTTGGDRFAADVFIDATYEGDLMARAKVPYTVGREGRDQYGESLAGVQKNSPSHQWPVDVPARDAAGKPLPCVQAEPVEPAGTADRKVQAYNFRLCMTQDPKNLVPWPKPAGYDPGRYELLARYVQLKPNLTVRNLMNPVAMPNGKTDTNNNGAFSTDHIGASWDYPDADPAARRRIWDDHVAYQQGFYYFLAHDPRVPKDLQKEINSWGLAQDEFLDTQNWPHQLYVREGRRMLGAFVMTEKDIMAERTKDDSVGLGSYNTDSHHVQRVVTAEGFALNEGDFQVGVAPYAIPYRSLTPKLEHATNLLVPVCLSASHVAYGTIRMEPVYMILGQASGVAAAMAVQAKGPVQEVPVAGLQEKLKAQKAVLSPAGFGEPPKPARRLAAKDLPGITVDDAQATVTGAWRASASLPPVVESTYLTDDNEAKAEKSVRFVPALPRAGRYEVRFYFSPGSNRAAKVPVVVHHAGGETTVTVNQQKPPATGDFASLGVFGFEAGKAGWVEVQTRGTDGHVIADAVGFVEAAP